MSLNSTGWPGIALQIRAKCQHRPKWTVVSRGVNEVKSSGGLVQSPMLQENQILSPNVSTESVTHCQRANSAMNSCNTRWLSCTFLSDVFSPDLAICAHSARRTAL